MGYKPAPENAIALRFVRKTRGERIEHIIAVIPFKGELGKLTLVVIAMKPLLEGIAFQLDKEAGILRVIAKVPEGKPSQLLPTGAQTATSITSSSTCPPCTYPAYQCVEWDIQTLIECGTCVNFRLGVCPANPACFVGCLIACAAIWCPICYVLACKQWAVSCADCLPACTYIDCCYNCPPCLNTPACLGGLQQKV